MKALRYEKVGDITTKYSYLQIFFEDENEAFMEIGVTDNKELSFKTYSTRSSIELTIENWEDILKVAKAFLPEALKDEEDFESFIER